MQISFKALKFGESYDRPFLAKLWGYESHKAIERGVVTPAGTKFIILFVTKTKQESLTQYNDFIDGDLLFWEGEEKHGSDTRVAEANKKGDEIHLFYREIHHTPFVYFGRVSLTDYRARADAPSEFIFRIAALSTEIDAFKEVREHAAEYKTLAITEQEQIVASRLGQGNFRRNLVRLWGSCSLTGLQNITLLRASHIKPWKVSTNSERLTPYNGLLLIPNYDLLLDKGLITFRDNGSIVISNRLDSFGRKIFRVDESLRLRRTFTESREFLEYHQDKVFN
jgi:putative restriction endonuclease